MKSIYIDCRLGISGVMLASALLDLGVPHSIFLDNLVSLNMDKNYNFDCNLKCNFPPLYPENIESNSRGNVQEAEKKYNV